MDIEKQDDGTVIIKGEIPFEELTKHKEAALKKLGKEVEVEGFRKGKVPVNMLEKHVKRDALLREMAEHALGEHYPRILEEHNVSPLGRPNISITKLADDNPLGFTISTAVMPDIELPDYKAIAASHDEENSEDVDVTDEEVDKAAKETMKYYRKQKNVGADAGESEEGGEEHLIITDEMVKEIGDFASVKAFKDQIREQMKQRKKQMAVEKGRMAMLDAIVSKTKIDVPDVLVEGELGKMLARFQADVERAGMTFDDYLKQINKTVEDLRKEWRPDAVKQAKTQLVLNQIAQEENITPDKKRLESEVKHVLEHHDDADAEVVRIYVASLLTNEKVLEFLESQGV